VFVPVVFDHAMRMLHVVICDLSDSIVLYFSTFSQTMALFGGVEIIEHKICFDFSLELSSDIFFIKRRIKMDIIINLYTSSRKVPVILVRFFNET
jgi:hypothetical protein